MDSPTGDGTPPGRARGRARGQARADDEQPATPSAHRVSPPGRSLEPRLSQLTIGEGDDDDRLTRYGSNGNGNGNGNGGNGTDRDREGEPRAPPTNLDRYDFVISRPNENFPKAGKFGEAKEYYANYFPVTTHKDWAIFQYRVDFAPAVDSTRVRQQLFRPFRKPIAEGGFGGVVFDGHSVWTSQRFVPDFNSPAIVKTSVLENDGTIYTLKIKMVARFATKDPTYLQFMNMITRTCLRALKLCQMGRNYFDPTDEVQLANHRLKLWPGFVTTMRQHDFGLLYCVELTHKVIRMDNCLDIMERFRREAQERRQPFKEAITKELVGSIVLTVYNNRTYRVDDISWNENPASKFKLKDGTEITFKDYYRKYDRHPIRNMGQPLLVSNPKPRDMRAGNKDPVKLVPELCLPTGLTDQMRANFGLMKDLGEHFFQPPQKKMEKTINFMKRIGNCAEAQAELRGWGMELSKAPLAVPGRILPREGITLVNKIRNAQDPWVMTLTDEKADFSKAFRGAGLMLKNVNLSTWVIIVGNRDANGVDNVVSTMQRVSTPLGFNISPATEIIRLGATHPEAYSTAVQQAINKHREMQMIFVILPNNRLETYSAVKKKCYLDYALPSQCFLAKNVNAKGLMSIATKVVIQMNVKLGGEAWGVRIPLKSLMVVGFDVHHAGVIGNQRMSVGAMVATVSDNYCTYYSTASFAENGVELSENMANDIEKCANAFRKANNGLLPDRIIFYRDGVGQGQLGFVYKTELEALKNKLKDVYVLAGKEPPKFTMIVCTKRINTRIFLKTGIGRVDNPPPGTVVDSRITLPERWDFFLVAQNARQGMVSPTNYNVLFDQNALDADKVQRLTFKLTHMYYNWQGTVAVPAVVQYAHKLAFLTGTALGRPGHSGLSHTLYFL